MLGRRVGAHVSISVGLDKAAAKIKAMGGNALQIFSSSPRMWLAELPNKEQVKKIKDQCQQDKIWPVFIHAKYLVNLVSDNPEIKQKSWLSLKHDLIVAGMIGAEGVIVHLGSHKGLGFKAVEFDLIKQIKTLFEQVDNKAELIIENSAGQKGKLCSQLSDIGLILKSVNNTRLAWCLDTCHAWAAGINFGKTWENNMMQNDLVRRLVCLHINGSRDEFGSGRDRHANLGEGKMGLDYIKFLINHRFCRNLPLILETPGFDNRGPDEKNLNLLKALCD